MKFLIRILCLFYCFSTVTAQDGFVFTSNKKKARIPFKLINNLIIIPIKVNGVELNFLLDTGVEETILFSLGEKDEVTLKNVEKIKLKGLGNADAIEGLKSDNNLLSIRNMESRNQNILIVLDQTFNFSSSLGIAVNGIIGYEFFRNNFVEIDYASKKIYVYNLQKVKKEKRVRKYTSFDITIEKNKPYIQGTITMDETPIVAKLLLDTGNSESIWLFRNKSNKIIVPEKNFEDFLGRGFSGDIYGKKARITDFALDKFDFKNPIVSFPDTVSIRHVKMVDDRLGSIGGEILKRFSLIFDYNGNKFYLKKNADFDAPFQYNMSGITLHHAGLRWVQEMQQKDREPYNSIKIDFGERQLDVKYKFELKPIYEVSDIRKDSPADLAGIKKGDIIVTINKSNSYRYSLQQINNMLKSEEGKSIEIEVERNDKLLTFKIKLKSLL